MGAFDDLIQQYGQKNGATPSEPVQKVNAAPSGQTRQGGAFDDLIQQYSPKEEPSTMQKIGMYAPNFGIAETIGAVGSGILGSAIGGLGGIGAALSKMAGITDIPPEEVVKSIQQGLTYQPRTELGKQGVEAIGQISTLGGLIPKAAEAVGGAALEATGSPLLATGAHLATEAIPQILGAKGAAMAAPTVARAAERTVSPLFERFVSKAEAPAAGAAETAIPGAAQPTAQEAANSWLLRKLRGEPEPATMPGMGAAETGVQRQRLERAQGLAIPVQPKLGDITREAAQQQFERETAKLPEGVALRERDTQNNLNLLNNFDVFREETGGIAPDPVAMARNVDTVLRNRMARAQEETSRRYTIARQHGDMDQPLPVDPLINYVNENFSSATNAPVLKVIDSELRRFGVAETGPDGRLIPTGQPMSINDLETVRKTIGDNWSLGPNEVFGPRGQRVIDAITEGQGGELYQQARRSHERYAREFEDQSAIARLMAVKPGTRDRAIALEDVWQKAIPGDYSIQDLRNLRTSLFRGGPEGAQAWRDIGGVTMDWIKEQATRTTAMDELGNPIVGAAGMRKAMKTIGRDKLEMLYGKRGTTRLNDLAEVIDDLKIAPPGTVNWSNTAATIIAALTEAGATFALTGLPVPIASSVRIAVKMVKNKKLRNRIEASLHPSINTENP